MYLTKMKLQIQQVQHRFRTLHINFRVPQTCTKYDSFSHKRTGFNLKNNCVTHVTSADSIFTFESRINFTKNGLEQTKMDTITPEKALLVPSVGFSFDF